MIGNNFPIICLLYAFICFHVWNIEKTISKMLFLKCTLLTELKMLSTHVLPTPPPNDQTEILFQCI